VYRLTYSDDVAAVSWLLRRVPLFAVLAVLVTQYV